jgi:nucleoside-diphosphate-sugar epimerase
LQFVEDVAATFVKCLERPYSGAKSYNLRGHVVDLQAFHKALCFVAPEARDLITFGDKQIPIAYDLDDSALQRDLGPMPLTPLEEGIRKTLNRFRQLRDEGRLDDSDLQV